MIADGSAQYRSRYAEPESRLASLVPHSFDCVMVVPVYAESADFIDGYGSATARAGRLLVIVVLNGRAGAEASVHAANAACFRALSARFSLRELGSGGWFGGEAQMSLLVVDRFTAGRRLPSRQGVGLTRKIGADIALECIAAGRVLHPWIAMMDADACVPADYFERIAGLDPSSDPKCSAALFPFWHEPSGDAVLDRATALYELRLRFYQRGLRWADSPYAFHTVGSTMVVHALCYAQVRGVPVRQAAEDFYLLGKLSKVRPLARLGGAPVRLRSRLSTRVPFGTGADSTKLARGATFELYDPDCFTAVRDVIRGLERVSALPSPHQRAIEKELSRLSPTITHFLEERGALEVWPRLGEQAPTPAARLRRLHEWFDGFRTLKLIHHVRDHLAPAPRWQDAIRRAPFMDAVDDDGECLIATRAELLRREQTLPRLVGPSVYR